MPRSGLTLTRDPFNTRRGSVAGSFSPKFLNPLAWYDIDLATPGQTLADQMGGSAATLGSTAGSDSNDPLWLQYAGSDYVYLPGTAGNFISTPATAALNITSDIDIIVRFKPGSMTTGHDASLISRWGPTAADQQWIIVLRTSGRVDLVWLNNAALYSDLTGVNTTPITASTTGVRVTLSPSTGAVVYYYTTDSLTTASPTWTQVASGTSAQTGTIASNVITSLYIGSDTDQAAGRHLDGSIISAQIRSGIGGSLVANFDASNFAAGSSTTYVDAVGSNGGTWTINRGTSGRKTALIKGHGTLLLGTDDYVNVPITAMPNMTTSDKFTVVSVWREYDTPASYGKVWSTKTGGTAAALGTDYVNETTLYQMTAYIGDGTNSVSIMSPAFGSRIVAVSAFGYDGANFTHSMNGTSATPVARGAVGTVAGTVCNIGRNSGTGGYADMEFFAFLTFQRQLTNAEIALLVSYYQGGT